MVESIFKKKSVALSDVQSILNSYRSALPEGINSDTLKLINNVFDLFIAVFKTYDNQSES